VVTDSIAGLAATRIVVAHRLSTIAAADRVIVIDRGRVVEDGTPDHLRSLGGVFARLAARQTL
jgi:ATP-binding cassette subfamily C protein